MLDSKFNAAAGTVLSALLLCACATLPRSESQQIANANAAKVVSDSQLGLSGSAVQPATADGWWKSFNDPQLDRLIEQTLNNNPNLEQAGARLREAQAQLQAAHAGQLPRVNLDAGETRLKIPNAFPQGIGGGGSVWAGDLGAALSWDLDLWGKQADAVAQSRALASVAALDIENARLMLSGAVAQAYVDLYRGYLLADIAERAAAQRANILDITRQRLAAGLDTRVELREAEGAVPQARLSVTQAQSEQALATHQLAALSGHGADAYASITRPEPNLDAALPLPTELPINLLARRPDVIAARARIEAADAGQHAAKAAFYPRISLTALVGYASFGLSDLISAQSFGYGAGPALSLPLFDAGRLRAQYRGAAAGLDEAVANYNDVVMSAVRQAADQLSLIDTLQRELEQQHESLQAAEEAYRLAEERYRAGLAGYLTVLNAETEVLNARRQRVDLDASLATARVALLLAVGGSFQAPPAAQVTQR